MCCTCVRVCLSQPGSCRRRIAEKSQTDGGHESQEPHVDYQDMLSCSDLDDLVDGGDQNFLEMSGLRA